MEPHGQNPCLPQAGVIPCPTPMWGDIPVTRLRIPPRPKAVPACRQKGVEARRRSLLLPEWNQSESPCSSSLLQDHLNGPFGTNGSTDATSLTVIKVNQDPPCGLISSDTEIWAEEGAKVTGLTPPDSETALSLLEGFLFPEPKLYRGEPFFPLIQWKTSPFRTPDNIFFTRLRHCLPFCGKLLFFTLTPYALRLTPSAFCLLSSQERYWWIDLAPLFPAAIASIAHPGPVTTSPPAKTPLRLVAPVSGSIFTVPSRWLSSSLVTLRSTR